MRGELSCCVRLQARMKEKSSRPMWWVITGTQTTTKVSVMHSLVPQCWRGDRNWMSLCNGDASWMARPRHRAESKKSSMRIPLETRGSLGWGWCLEVVVFPDLAQCLAHGRCSINIGWWIKESLGWRGREWLQQNQGALAFCQVCSLLFFPNIY